MVKTRTSRKGGGKLSHRSTPPMDQTVRTLQKKRTSNFREDETKLLIQLWGSPFIQKKLYLTHRKAPVMRILAANMQQRGFYRTPDEIKTRIRNLKCLYHRIKRSMTCGTGMGTIDPDWPHFKAMDAILNKEAQKKTEESALEGPRCEDIKQEVEIDINDDMESWATNDSMNGSEASEETVQPPPPMPTLQPAPTAKILKPKESSENRVNVQQNKTIPTIIPNVTIPAQNFQLANNASKPAGAAVPSYPLPLLILNGVQSGQALDKNKAVQNHSTNVSTTNKENNQEMCTVLKELLTTQKETLEIERQRLELEKQRMEFDRVVGSQLLTLVPVVGAILQRLAYSSNQDILNAAEGLNASGLFKNGRKRGLVDELDILKDSKILRTVLEQGIKKCMMESEAENNDEEKESDSESTKSVKKEKSKNASGD